jgi:hypothetical protein
MLATNEKNTMLLKTKAVWRTLVPRDNPMLGDYLIGVGVLALAIVAFALYTTLS